MLGSHNLNKINIIFFTIILFTNSTLAKTKTTKYSTHSSIDKLKSYNIQQEAKNTIDRINNSQQAYWIETLKFATHRNDLRLLLPDTYYNYAIDVIKNGKLAQIKVTPKFNRLDNYSGSTSYIGGAIFFKDTGVFESIVCVSDRPLQDIPDSIQLVRDELHCPTGFKIVLQDLQQEILNTIETINKFQQAYFFKTSNFTDNKYNFGFLPSDNYSLDVLEDGKLAIVTTTPNFHNLGSYVGGIFYSKNKFNSIVCFAEQSRQNILRSIKVVDGKLNCPTGFIPVFSPVEQEARNTVDLIERAQQAYVFETSNFANNLNDLEITISDSHYLYSIDILEKSKLTQLIATPNFSKLRSFIGGIFYSKNKLSSIVCVSEQPIEKISRSIKLVDDKLECPKYFQEIEKK